MISNRWIGPFVPLTLALALATFAPAPAGAQEPPPAEPVPGEGSGRPLDGYFATSGLAGLALFLIAKSARRSSSRMTVSANADRGESAAVPLSRDDVAAIYRAPALGLILRAADVHRKHHAPGEVQVCVLLSVKTGGCPEDCGYCPQAARYQTHVTPEGLMDVGPVLDAARRARDDGATRFCMGAAWREARDGKAFDRVLDMIRGVKRLGLEACCTLGMVTEDQARRMKEAGLDAYNHNLDSSEEFYDRIVSTRTYRDRLRTLDHVRAAGISVCCGGIVGMGETEDDRIGLLHTLATLPEPPESVPINALVAVAGTPLADRPRVDVWEMVRTIASARILMPRSMVRLSAGRVQLTEAEQALCFLAGANSIFAGDKLLTTPNPGVDQDQRLFDRLGLSPMPARVVLDRQPS